MVTSSGDAARVLRESASQPFIQKPLSQQAYRDWEFEVRDPNGYVVVFGKSY